MEKKEVILKAVCGYEEKNLKTAIEEIFSKTVNVSAFSGKKVLVKPNFLTVEPPAFLSSTHPKFIEQILCVLIDMGSKPFISDIPVLGTLKQTSKKSGLESICKHLNVPIIPAKKTVVVSSPKGFEDITLPQISSLAFDCDYILNLPKLKVHDQLSLTAAVKNLFGFVKLGKRISLHQRGNLEEFIKILLALAIVIKPTLNILDGITAMDTKGPRGGRCRELGIVAGCTDPLGLDLAAAKLVNANTGDIPLLKTASQMNILEEIMFSGEELQNLVCKDFVLPVVGEIAFHPIRSVKIILRDILKKAKLIS